MKKIVAIGGGSGLSTLLRGLRDYPLEITAIVTMTDDGASSGLLRKDFGILPPGDIRKCIAALSEDETLLVNLFQYRFKKGFGLKGHSLGNLLIGALKEITGSFEAAVGEISDILKIKGTVLPASLSDIHLVAKFEDGREIQGESKITKYGYKHKITKIKLNKAAKANKKALEAISAADVILVGPGSTFTSVLPNFLIRALLKEYNASEALKIYIGNISTERGETENFPLSEHMQIFENYGIFFDQILANSKLFPKNSGDGFLTPVLIDVPGVIKANLIDERNLLYHDPEKLATVLWKIILNAKKHKKGSVKKPFYVLKS